MILQQLHFSLNLVAAIITTAVTLITLIWNFAEFKRKLENQFQANEKEMQLFQKNLEIDNLSFKVNIQDKIQNILDSVNKLGSQVDNNKGAIEAFKALRENSSVLKNNN